MPVNVEIKAILHNPMAAEAIAARLSDRTPETIDQEDLIRVLGPRVGAEKEGS